MQQRAPHRVAMRKVARGLGISVRSLHRRLTEEGQSYVSLANEASALLAKQLLVNEGRTIHEAAHTMGFSDVSSFHRAFRRWTGTTPRALVAGGQGPPSLSRARGARKLASPDADASSECAPRRR